MTYKMGELPQRWQELDKRTIEMIARFNEDERSRLIEIINLSEKEMTRLLQFLSLDDEKWEAGFNVVTRSVSLSRVYKALRKFPIFVGAFAALLIALNQIPNSIMAIVRLFR